MPPAPGGGGAIGGEDAPATVYRRQLERGVLAYQRCRGCGLAIFFPRVLCPGCGGTRLGWEESAGTGTVYSSTTLHRRGEEPYDVSLVDLDEGFRMMSSVVGTAPGEVRIGMRVRVAIDLSAADGPLPRFVAQGR
jgi:uncharacterized OB-fold protein